jgi:cobalt/nickel transport protein
LAGNAVAHYQIFLPDKASARKGETVTLTYRWGHPFEHQLFDAPAPKAVWVIAPDGKRTDLTSTLEKTTEPAGTGQATVYRLRFTPTSRGDYVFGMTAAPIWMEEDQEFLDDVVEVVLHVQAQKGWEQGTGAPLELTPLTRPYGLKAPTSFQVQARADGKAVAGALVEIERYNPTPPAHLPADEEITATARSDPNGCCIATLPEAGWWCLTVITDGGTRAREGKNYPVRRRATLWVFVAK